MGGGYDKIIGVFIVFKNGFYIIFCNIMDFFYENFWVKIMINGLIKVGVMVYFGLFVNVYHIGFNFIV